MAAESEAWTFVKPRSRKSKKNNSKSNSSAPQLPQGAQTSAEAPPSFKPRTSNLRSVDEIEAEYSKVRAEWLDSECCTRLRELVKKQSIGKGTISKAICLGVGTFDPEDGAWAQKRISYHQLIAFTVMVEELEKMNQSALDCIQQDPIFTDSDKGFLVKLGHKVLESPAAYTEVDENTFLYGVHLYRPVYAASLKDQLPRIFIGTGYDEWESATMGSLDDIQPMKTMEAEYTKIAFPEDNINATFHGTSIYWSPQIATASHDEKKTSSATENKPVLSNDPKKDTEEDLIEKLAATKIT